jgi:hypothetical protein
MQNGQAESKERKHVTIKDRNGMIRTTGIEIKHSTDRWYNLPHETAVAFPMGPFAQTP